MPPELKKVTPTRLCLLGLDERWLQVRIEEDPSLLGLGDINVVRREKSQPSGGRLDFLMYDPDRELRYEVEIMLGVLDESHIIHTRLRTGAETREVILRQLEDAGIGATPFQSEVITIKLLQKHLDDSRAIMLDVLRHCERQSKTNSEQAV